MQAMQRSSNSKKTFFIHILDFIKTLELKLWNTQPVYDMTREIINITGALYKGTEYDIKINSNLSLAMVLVKHILSFLPCSISFNFLRRKRR